MEGIKQVTIKELVSIIDTRQPRGLFYYNPDKLYLGCDNTNGDAWVEEFNNKEDCIAWLKGGGKLNECTK